MNLTQYFSQTWRGLISLFSGLGVTFSWFLRFRDIKTEQYPENKATLKQHARFRGRVVMPHDENGDHLCTGCGSCERACPNGSLSVLNTKSMSGKRVLGKYVYRLDTCTLCGLCVESCGYDAIKMADDFELASNSRDEYELVLNKKEGRS